MNLSSQSILEAAFTNSSQFTLQSPRLDTQRYFEFTNLNEQTPSFNRECFKDPVSPKIHIHQNFQFYPDQQNQTPTPSQLSINQIYLTKINLCSKNLNSQLDQGYIIQIPQNMNQSQPGNDIYRCEQPYHFSQQEADAIQYNYLASFQNSDSEAFRDSLFSKKKYSQILQQNQEQQLEIKNQQKFQSNQANFNSKASGNTEQIQNSAQLVQQRGRQSQFQQNLINYCQKDQSPNIKSFTQQKLDSLRSSQNRKYFLKSNENNQKQKQNRQQQTKTPIKNHAKETNEEDKENQTKRMLQQMSQQNLNNKSLNSQQWISNVKQNLKHPLKDTNNFQIHQFYEQRVYKIVNKINNKFN
ncbi:hypothetical protein TTHERM_00637460 (macronuclear) [Tetrahymena thermophila SB210]|uniref:Uncharacterized protein n=1 Tax=Tetrahymena thermophila (strain SB210) TaxID=312017 RepID=Q22HF7_TETTS|nr:hypothetical protein TTHERM_00637460 [Tetrahymena thermophila SB210]EAR84744.2 hypothetical protein TTHERM_00637460 [Tetrahymena thermophila SB210]|eukprot:XP_001032407.2 hypothetical protein TTHERM_00637460 [Tetrahymena thermophila SB210]